MSAQAESLASSTMELCSPLAREMPLPGHILFHFCAVRTQVFLGLFPGPGLKPPHINLAGLGTGLNHCPWRISLCFPRAEHLGKKSSPTPLRCFLKASAHAASSRQLRKGQAARVLH